MTPSQSQPISSPDSLITKLRENFDLTGEQIADVLWLTLEFQKFEASFSKKEQNFDEQDKNRSKENSNVQFEQLNQSINSASSNKTSTTSSNPSKSKKNGSIYTASSSGESQGLTIGVPDAPSLREPLTLANAFRPLMRRVATGRKIILDEAATVQRIAEERIFIPVLRAEPEPWLDLALVIDESHSMLIWGHTIRELKEIFKKYGIFRDIRVWGLQPDEAGNNLQLFSRMGSNKRLTEPKEIIDPTGRRLILIVSDCVSSIWRKGMMFPVLKAWTQKQPLVILQMLPEWMWRRTALDLGTAVGFKSSILGAANQELSLHKPLRRSRSIGFKVEDRSKIPVITLDSEDAAQWSQMLVGKADARVAGYLLPPELEIEEEEIEHLQIEKNTLNLNAIDRVRRFQMATSPLGRELAGLLAASPVISLPVVRLIQESLLSKSSQIQVAEVFLGGLLQPKSASLKYADANPDVVEYEFIEPEIRDIFLDDAPVSDSVDVVNAVSRYVAEQLGVSLSEFMAFLKAPQKVEEKQREDTVKPFAEITARVLRKLGGEYVKFAEELEEARSDINTNITDGEKPQDDRSSSKQEIPRALKQSIEHHQGQINCVVFSPNGKLIASAGHDGRICLSNLNGDLITTFGEHQDKVWSIAFSSDGQLLVSGSDDGNICLWEVSKKKLVCTWKTKLSVYSVAGHPSLKVIASVGQSRRIDIHSIDGISTSILEAHQSIISSVVFSPDGKLLASCGDNHTIKILNWATKELIITLDGHQNWVNAIAFHPNGDFIVSASSDKTVRLWSVNEGTSVKTYEGHTNEVSSVAFCPSAKIIASGSCDGTVRLWNFQGDLLGEPLIAHHPHVKTVAFSPDGKLLASGGSDGIIKLWRKQEPERTDGERKGPNTTDVASSNTLKKILLLAANPKGTTRLRMEQEVREIGEGLQRARHREQFELVQRWAVRPQDVRRAMLDEKPQIVHFSGHGAGEEGLVFENEVGQPKLVTGEALAGLFELFAPWVGCVVLNGCYSQVQAEAVAQHIPYVVGMKRAIGDKAAIAFAVGFYDALGAGETIEFAYALGCNAIQMEGITEHLTPVLLKREKGAIAGDPSDSAPTTQPTSTEDNAKQISEPLQVFISYSHKDDDLREELEMHLSSLRRQGKIKAWHDRAIEAGAEWDAEIKAHLESARIILLLISSRFMASESCYDQEMQLAMERHYAGTARVIPVILKPVDWKDTPFSKLQVLPKDGKPINTWDNQDEAFLNVVEGIKRAIEQYFLVKD